MKTDILNTCPHKVENNLVSSFKKLHKFNGSVVAITTSDIANAGYTRRAQFPKEKKHTDSFTNLGHRLSMWK